MPLDPLSALSVAASVVQFVDFAGRIVSKGKDIYESSDGALQENLSTETVTVRLREKILALESSRRLAKQIKVRPEKAHQEAAQRDQRLDEICKDCSNLSKKLLHQLGELKVPKGSEHRRWKSFRQALKSVWSKDEIDAISARLRDLRDELDSEVLDLLREKIDASKMHQQEHFLEIKMDSQVIMENLLRNRVIHSDELRKHFEKLTESQKQEHAKTRASFVHVDTEKRKERIQLDLLESLRFPQILERYERVAKNHEKTFSWIFETESSEKPWDNFVQWLQYSRSTYWIQGKAASGKSTLMRFIWNNPLTLEGLETWSKGSPLLVGSFFFWNSGIEVQRSQVGLLRSLLYEALNTRRHFLPDVFPAEWDSKSVLVAHDLAVSPESWTLPRLQSAFRKLVTLACQELKMCFFVDGLDEYEGEPEDIAQYFQDLLHCSNHVKFCVSSRPWPVFEDIFKNCPGLKLQDLTRGDIKLYINDKLGSNSYMQQLLTENPREATSLIDEVVDKAAGVFLWVVLVVKSFINGLRNGDGLSHLRSRLESLPSDLEKLYEHMLKSIDPLDKVEAAGMFQIFRLFQSSGHILDIAALERALRFADYRRVVAMETKTEQPTDQELNRTNILLERAVKRLNSRCKGLLEARGSDATSESPMKFFMEGLQLYDDDTSYTTSSAPPHSRAAGIRNYLVVTYLHRTVRDYLEQPAVWNDILLQTKHTGFDADAALLMSYVIDIKFSDWFIDESVYEAAKAILERLARLKPITSECHVHLIEELDRAFTIRWRDHGYETNAGHWSNGNPRSSPWEHPTENGIEWQSDILCMGIICRINWYLDAKIASFLSQSAPAGRPGLPLLAYTLGSNKWSSKKPKAPDPSVVENLLQHGANPNEWYKGCTLWQYTLHYLHVIHMKKDSDPFLQAWLQTVNLLLKYGADPNACWTEDEDTRTRHWKLKHDGKKGQSLKSAVGYDVFKIPPHIWIRDKNSSMILSKGQKYKELQHSVSEVIFDVFGDDIPDVYEEIHVLIEKERSATSPLLTRQKVNPNARRRRKKNRQEL